MIQDVVPAYSTDALLRRVNVDRYDDREIVETNLIESYEKLLAFVQKHLLDKFFLENGQRISLRYIIARELVSNILMHREYTSPHHARIVIESNKIYTVNASRATQEILITPANLEPISKNPIIAKFFREIGFADTMGSGVRKLFKYTKPYSGEDPIFEEGDIFRITVPLNDSYSYDAELETQISVSKDSGTRNGTRNGTRSANSEEAIIKLIRRNAHITRSELAVALGISVRSVSRILEALPSVKYIGKGKNGHWEIDS